ncbi:hypothetical protein ACOSP7_031295 [Xanthoceras sorbifolium]
MSGELLEEEEENTMRKLAAAGREERKSNSLARGKTSSTKGENQQTGRDQRQKIKGEPWRERERAWAVKKREQERLLRH